MNRRALPSIAAYHLATCFFTFVFLLTVTQPVVAASKPYEIEIVKSQRVLLVKNGNKIEKSFRVASGRGGKGDKKKLGDHKTPVGIYRIIERKDSEKFHIFLRLNYPNVKDAFWGLKNRVITRGEFDAIVQAYETRSVPPQDTALGGSVGIHGIGAENVDTLDVHAVSNWTEGCVALTNEQLEELLRYVDIGTRVVISE